MISSTQEQIRVRNLIGDFPDEAGAYRLLISGYLFLLFSACIGAFIKPVGFQKSASIKERDPREWDGIVHGEIDGHPHSSASARYVCPHTEHISYDRHLDGKETC